MRRQMLVPDLYVYTLKFLAYKKKKKKKKNQGRRYNVFKKKLFCFAHKKLKKPPSKVAHNRPKPFISQSSPQPTAQN